MNRALIKATITALALLLPTAAANADPPGFKTLAIGSTAPDFRLPGVDGKTHSLADFGQAKVLVVIFTCNHCPTAQAYEGRIARLDADYRDKGVAVVAISPNNPAAVRLDELGYTDLGDSFEEMKIRAKDHQLRLSVSLRRRDSGDGHGLRRAWPRRKSSSSTPSASSGTPAGSTTVRSRPSSRMTPRTPSMPSWPASRSRSRRPAFSAARPSGPRSRPTPGNRCERWDAEPVSLAPDRPRRRGQARQERHEEALAREPLGDLVRPVRRRAARARHDEPDVSRAELSARDHQPRRPRRSRTMRSSPQGEPRLGDQLHPERRTTATSSPRRSIRSGPVRSPTPS